MSSFLYRLGRACFRHAKRVLAAWLAVLVLLGVLAATVGGRYVDRFEIPGAPSQVALDRLKLTFPDAAATSASVIVVVPEGQRVDDAAHRAGIARVIQRFDRDRLTGRITGPFDRYSAGMVSDDHRAAMLQVTLDAELLDVTDADRTRLTALARQAQADMGPGSQVSIGGQPFSVEVPQMSATEGAGLVVALLVLVATLGSIVAAGLPLLTAVLGVGASMLLITVAARLTDISSTTPMLAVMLGLAVGIDYALFILSRHREQLRTHEGGRPLDAEESAARAVATAGSAVVFAGVTVCIALIGLALAGIPFLTSMGTFASLAVALAVVIALTALPALMGLLGERMRPRRRRRGGQSAGEATGGASAPRRRQQRWSPTDWWVRTATRVPLLTIAVVTALLGALSVPAAGLWLSLPNAGQSQPGTTARTTYDLVTEHFGPGYNGPIIVTADIIGSNDPLGIMKKLKSDVEATEGVETVLVAVPNQNADTGIVQVVPTTGPDDPATGDLVQRLVDRQAQWRTDPGVQTAITGSTAIQIDISDRLGKALVPFGIFVVGLSALLLMMVFRSIWVPLKAAAGFVLSVGAAFGATQLVFNRGIGASIVNLDRPTPIISFMPIIIMGILFGLAMDYEVFLVSRMREDYVHGLRRDPSADPGRVARTAIRSGFNGSAVVVTAAAVIMFSVFAFFVPQGQGPIKQIAFGLALGVAADAFLVRMTLVPAVMQLLGARAWWLPRWLDKRLPVLDVEGEALHRELELADWPSPDHTEALVADELAAEGVFGPTSLTLLPGQVGVVTGDEVPRQGLLLALTGRLATNDGRARVAGQLLADQPAAVRAGTTWIDATGPGSKAPDVDGALARALSDERVRLVVVDDADALTGPARQALADAVTHVRTTGGPALLLGAHDPAALGDLCPEAVVEPTGAHRPLATTTTL